MTTQVSSIIVQSPIIKLVLDWDEITGNPFLTLEDEPSIGDVIIFNGHDWENRNLVIADITDLTDTLNGKEGTLNTDQKRKITISSSEPSGGSNGDIWLKYTP